jgi:thiamine-monophosphate kinase
VTAVPGGEFEVIARIQQRLRGEGAGGAALRGPAAGEVFSGDDAAVVSVGPPGRLLLAIDLVVQGVHVDLQLASLADMGWKAISVNASDIAAMGGRPLHVVAGVAAPPSTDLDAITEGMAEACGAYGIALVGGDLTGGRDVVISVAITGTCDDRQPVLRSGARAGDLIWVTGPLGASAAGLRLLQRPGGLAGGDEGAAACVAAYRRPVARIAEGMAAATAGATAMIDVSDGLSRDLDHIARQSGVGVRLESVPVFDGATPSDALGGGEDYELVFTAPADAAVAAVFLAAGLGAPVRIGTCSDDAEERSLAGEPLVLTGWEHRFGGASG